MYCSFQLFQDIKKNKRKIKYLQVLEKTLVLDRYMLHNPKKKSAVLQLVFTTSSFRASLFEATLLQNNKPPVENDDMHHFSHLFGLHSVFSNCKKQILTNEKYSLQKMNIAKQLYLSPENHELFQHQIFVYILKHILVALCNTHIHLYCLIS